MVWPGKGESQQGSALRSTISDDAVACFNTGEQRPKLTSLNPVPRKGLPRAANRILVVILDSL
jgi:hypothetical protein